MIHYVSEMHRYAAEDYEVNIDLTGPYLEVYPIINYISENNGFSSNVGNTFLKRCDVFDFPTQVYYSKMNTVLRFHDESRTIVRCCPDERFDFEKGAMMAFLKHNLDDVRWKSFKNNHNQFDTSPWEEKNSARILIIVMFGQNVYDKLIREAQEAWDRTK